MSQSSNSAARRAALLPPLPQVACPDCKVRKVWCFLSQTGDNSGIRFYKCPNHGPGLPGRCDFWRWDAEYAYWLTGDGLPKLLEERVMAVTRGIGDDAMRQTLEDIKTGLMHLVVLGVVFLFLLLGMFAMLATK